MNKFIKNKSHKAKKDHFSLNRSDSFKKHFRQRLKDRHKIRGYCFSYTKDKIITPMPTIKVEKNLISEYYFNKSINDYNSLKHNIYLKERKLKEENSNPFAKNLLTKQINYTNINEFLSQYFRNKDKNSQIKYLINKRKIGIDNAGRNLKVNRLNSLLKKVSLHFTKIKEKIDFGQNEEEDYDINFAILLEKLQRSRKKLKTKLLDNSHKINKIHNKSSINFKRLANKENDKNDKCENNVKTRNLKPKLLTEQNSKYDISNNDSCNDKKNNKYLLGNLDKLKIRKKLLEVEKLNFDKINKNTIGTHRKNEVNNYRPLSYSGKRVLCSTKRTSILPTKTIQNSNFTNRFQSSIKRKKDIKVKNLPLYTQKSSYFIKVFNRIKSQSKRTKIQYMENNLTSFEKIGKIVETREDLKLFLLKLKFLNTKFPKKSSGKPINKKMAFIKKFKRNLAYYDEPYLRFEDDS